LTLDGDEVPRRIRASRGVLARARSGVCQYIRTGSSCIRSILGHGLGDGHGRMPKQAIAVIWRGLGGIEWGGPGPGRPRARTPWYPILYKDATFSWFCGAGLTGRNLAGVCRCQDVSGGFIYAGASLSHRLKLCSWWCTAVGVLDVSSLEWCFLVVLRSERLVCRWFALGFGAGLGNDATDFVWGEAQLCPFQLLQRDQVH